MPYVDDLFTKEELEEIEGTWVTCIDDRFGIESIRNFKQLPKQLQEEINAMQELRSYGFQELNGYVDRTIICSCGGYWTSDDHNAKFVVTSYGSHSWQWDGTTLRNTVKVYV